VNAPAPDWGSGSRFYVPNEDAAALRAALHELDAPPERPVFVGGSGMLLLEAARASTRLETAVFVDIAAFQCEYFRLLLDALASAPSPEALRLWFCSDIFPALQAHYRARGRRHSLPEVLGALEKLFGCRFMFEDEAFTGAKRTAGKAAVVHGDIAAYLSETGERHDFIYLSNISDYLDEDGVRGLFAACAAHRAPSYLLLTSACPRPESVRLAWEKAGFVPHASCARLNGLNRGLGSRALRRKWNRPGSLYLLMPATTQGRKTPC
jgi:hypothetical protein